MKGHKLADDVLAFEGSVCCVENGAGEEVMRGEGIPVRLDVEVEKIER